MDTATTATAKPTETLEPAVTDLVVLLAPAPKGLGLDLEDRGLTEALKRNPEALTKEAVAHLLKRRFVTAIAGKVFAVKAGSLPNVVRAIGRLLHLCNSHNRKLWEEFRGSGALEELMTRMGVIVGEGRYLLAGDLLQAFLPLLYVGDGLNEAGDETDDCGADFFARLAQKIGLTPQVPAPGQQQQQHQQENGTGAATAALVVKNKYVYSALVQAFYKIGSYHAQEGADADPGFVKYCTDFLDALMRVISSQSNMRPLMVGHPLVPILRQLGELPPEVAYKACTWVAFLCTYHRVAPLTELRATVDAARMLFERTVRGGDLGFVRGTGDGEEAGVEEEEVDSFRVFNLVRSLRYLVISTIQADARFKYVWYEAGLVDALLSVIGQPPPSMRKTGGKKKTEEQRPGVAPFTVSLAVDTLLWLVCGCAKNARLVVASGGAKSIEALLASDTHFPEGVSLWNALMRELSTEMTTLHAASPRSGGVSVVEDEQNGVSREFAGLLGVLLHDLETRFARGVHVAGMDAATAAAMVGTSFLNGGVIAMAYVRGLTATAEVAYAKATWTATVGQQAPPRLSEEGKYFQQCIMVLHALTSLLVPLDVLDLAPDRRATTPTQGDGGMAPASVGLLETAYDGAVFVVPMILASIRRHRGQALRWLTLKAPVTPAVSNVFARTLRIRRAFVRAGALERILAVLGQCVGKIEQNEWSLEKLCTTAEQRIAFGPFVGAGSDSDSYASGGNTQVGLANDENTALAEFLGSSLLVFAVALSRLHPTNSIEGAAAHIGGGGGSLAAAGGWPSHASARHSQALFRQLAGLLLRLLRKTFPKVHNAEPKVVQSVFFFVARFMLSTALGGYTPLVELVLNPRSGALQLQPAPKLLGPGGPDMLLMMGGGGGPPGGPGDGHSAAVQSVSQQELHSPRALLLMLELLAEYPVSTPEFAFLLPILQALTDFTKLLLNSEKNLELALDACVVKSTLWAALRPAAAHEAAEASLTSLLGFVAKKRTTSDDLRLWFNAVLCDYSETARGPRVEARRLQLLRVLVDVANGMAVPLSSLTAGAASSSASSSSSSAELAAIPPTNMEFLAQRYGHVFGSAALVVFDPWAPTTAGEERQQGPRLAIPSLHPEGFEGAASGGSESRGVRAWPPARGYTFSAWLCIEAYDRFTRRLPLLHLTEDGEVLTGLTITDGVLTLSSEQNGREDGSVVCDRLPKLVEGEWYHLTVAHHKSRNKAMHAVVYLNGQPAQTVRLAYPRPTQGLHKVQYVMGQARGGSADPSTMPQQQQAGASTTTRVKWALGPTYLLSEPVSDTQALLLYALGPTSALSFVGEDGLGSFPFAYDLCSAIQLRQLIQALKARAVAAGAVGAGATGTAGQPGSGAGASGGGGGNGGAGAGANAANGGGANSTGAAGGKVGRAQFTDLTAAPVDSTGITADQVVLSLAPRNASDDPTSLENVCAYSALCTQESLSVVLSGGALAVDRRRLADALRYATQFPLAPVMMLCERAQTVEELRLSLHFLLAILHAQPWNVQQMEKGHFYATLSQLLRRNARQGLIVVETIEPLLAMVGRVRLLQEDGAQECHIMPVNIQALQNLVFNFGIWKEASPDVHRMILETLGAAVAISGNGGNEAQLAAQELNLRRFQFAGITRSFLYMLIEPEISYDLLLSMCDLIYLILTRGPPPIEDLAAVSQLLIATSSMRFQKLYVDGLICCSGSVSASPPAHKQAPRLSHEAMVARAIRLKVIRRGLLRLLIKVAEHYVFKTQQASKHGGSAGVGGVGAGGADGRHTPPGPANGASAASSAATAAVADNEYLGLLLRAVPPKLLLHITYHFGDVLFWEGTATGKVDLSQVPFSAEAAEAAAAASAGDNATASSTGTRGKRRISTSASTVGGGKRTYRRHQDPISALLAYQLLVSVMPYAQKAVDRLGGLGYLQCILPCIFKSIDVQSDADLALFAASSSSSSSSYPPATPMSSRPNPSSATGGRHYIWQPKAVAQGTQDVSAFFKQPLQDASTSICSPSYQHCLRTLYKTLFAHLVGGTSLFMTLEQIFDGLAVGVRRPPSRSGSGGGGSPGKSLLPNQMIHVPGMLMPILSSICAASGMSTVEGLVATVAARPTTQGDNELHQLLLAFKSNTVGAATAKEFLTARSNAAGLVSEKALGFLHNLYLESQELRDLFRGDIPASMLSGGVSGGLAARFGSKLPKAEELMGELTQVYYSSLMAQLAQRFAPPPPPPPSATCGGRVTSKGALGASGSEASPSSPTTPTPALLAQLGESAGCKLALTFLVSLSFDRLVHQSKAVPSIQALLDVWPRDLHLFHPPSSHGHGSSTFAESLQAHFRSTLLHALLTEVQARLHDESGRGDTGPTLLWPGHSKLSQNLPRFFGLIAAHSVLVQGWTESPYLPKVPGQDGKPARDFWLLTNIQFLVDTLGLAVVASPASTSDQAPVGVVFRSSKQMQQQQQQQAQQQQAGKSSSSSSSSVSLFGGQAKQAMGGLFGISKWMGDDVEEWVHSAVDFLRKALLTGLGWLEDGLRDETVTTLFEHAIRHLGLLLPQLHTPRAAELDKQFVAALLHFLYPLLSDEKPQYREAAMYIWRELLASSPQRKVVELLLSVPQTITVKGKKGEPVEKVVTLNLLNSSIAGVTPPSSSSSDALEGFDMLLKVQAGRFGFLQTMVKPLPPPRAVKGLAAGNDFADKEFQSWLGSLLPDIQDKIPKSLAQYGRDFRHWPEASATAALQAYLQNVGAIEKRRVKGRYEGLKVLTKTTTTWRKELKAKQDMELRRQVRWPQERLDRETFGARHMEVLFAELMEGTSLAVAAGGVLVKGLGNGDGYFSSHVGEEDGAPEKLVQPLILDVGDDGLLEGMEQGVGSGDLCLDSAEGPMRIRKKLLRASFRLSRGPAPVLPPPPSPQQPQQLRGLPPPIASPKASLAPSLSSPTKVPIPASPLPLLQGDGTMVSKDVSSLTSGSTRPVSPSGAGDMLVPKEEASEFDFFSEGLDDTDDDVTEDEGTEDEEEEEEEEAHGGAAGEEDDEPVNVTTPNSTTPPGSPKGVASASSSKDSPPSAKEEEEEDTHRRSLKAHRLALHPEGGHALPAGEEEEGAGAAPSSPAANGGGEDEEEAAEDLVGADDKLKPFLVPGDEIKHRYNCTRVQGVYAYPGILLLAEGHLYIIDNYQLIDAPSKASSFAPAASYEVVEIRADQAATVHTPSSVAPRSPAEWLATPVLQNNPVTVSSRLRAKCAPGASSGPSHRCHYFPFEEVTVVYRRRYHLRHVAVEVFLSTGENHLITLEEPTIRNELLQKLKERCVEGGTLVDTAKASPLDEIQSFLNIANPSGLTGRWVRGEISNFQYLMHLNTLSGRSYNDLTQYPVFPWVLADWDSEELDFSNPSTFRDLTKPMGALSPAREMEFRERFALLKEGEQPGDPKKAFHYGTHFSSAAIVLYYLVRLQPFAEQHVRLQSGRFDYSDRLFSTMKKSWLASSGAAEGQESGASTNTQDVRELIPEFFYLPELLENKNGYDYGVELDGHQINDVGLPPWAKGSPQEFVRLHRQALESEYVTRNLHHWIDLIWGFKQRGKPAEEAVNVYYYLTYEGAIDLESVEDPNLRKAYVEQIHEFGQTPSQLFKAPHPARVFAPAVGGVGENGAGAGLASGGAGGVVGGLAPQWLRNLKPLGGRMTPPPPASSAAIVEDGMMLTMVTSGSGALGRPSVAVAAVEEDGLRTPLTGTLNGGLLSTAWLVKPGGRAWTVTEAKRLYTSDAAMRLLPPRRLATCLPAKVAQWAQVAAKYSGVADPNDPVNQLAIGQIVLPPSASAPVALHVGCVSLAQSETFVAWGFADDCLRVSSALPNAELGNQSALAGVGGGGAGVPDRKLAVALDAAGPVSVLALSADGRVMITGSSAQPVLHVWGLQKGLGTRGGGGGLRGRRGHPGAITLVGTLISALHAGSITTVALSAKYSIVVSVCSHNRVALLWDLNRRRLVRQLSLSSTHKPATDSANDLVCVSICETTGTIMLTAGVTIHVYDANGSPLACLDVSTLPLRESLATTESTSGGGGSGGLVGGNVLKAPATPISSCCVGGDGWSATTILTGHLDGQVRLWMLEYGKKPVVVGCEKQVASANGLVMYVASPKVVSSGAGAFALEEEKEEVVVELEEEVAEEEGGWNNCLTLVHELSYVSSASGGSPSKAPITALTLTPDLKRFYSGDTLGVVCAWSTVAVVAAGPASTPSSALR